MDDLQTHGKISVDAAKQRLRAMASEMDQQAGEQRSSALVMVGSLLAGAARGGVLWQIARGAGQIAWQAMQERRRRRL